MLHKIVQKKSDDNDLDLDLNEDGNGAKKKGKGTFSVLATEPFVTLVQLLSHSSF